MNHYQVLGIQQQATDDEIKQAYRKLALKCHPDKFENENDKQEANGRFIEISEAYQILINVDQRKKYDESLERNEQSKNNSPRHNFQRNHENENLDETEKKIY